MITPAATGVSLVPVADTLVFAEAERLALVGVPGRLAGHGPGHLPDGLASVRQLARSAGLVLFEVPRVDIEQATYPLVEAPLSA